MPEHREANKESNIHYQSKGESLYISIIFKWVLLKLNKCLIVKNNEVSVGNGSPKLFFVHEHQDVMICSFVIIVC